MATAAPTITNGVNVTQLVDTVNLIKQQPSSRCSTSSATRFPSP